MLWSRITRKGPLKRPIFSLDLKITLPPQGKATPTNTTATMSGWDEDDDFLDEMLNADDVSDVGNEQTVAAPAADVDIGSGGGIHQALVDDDDDDGRTISPEHLDTDGWGDDDDLLDGLSDELSEEIDHEPSASAVAVTPLASVQAVPPPPPPAVVAPSQKHSSSSANVALATEDSLGQDDENVWDFQVDDPLDRLDDVDIDLGDESTTVKNDISANSHDTENDNNHKQANNPISTQMQSQEDNLNTEHVFAMIHQYEAQKKIAVEEVANGQHQQQPVNVGDALVASAGGEEQLQDNIVMGGEEREDGEPQEWEFEDDEDIFNEENNERFDDGCDDEGLGNDRPYVGKTQQQQQQPMSMNPFLTDTKVPASNGDGWSDEEFFNDDDNNVSASVPPPPPPPPQPLLQNQQPPVISPPVSHRTRSKVATTQQSKPPPALPQQHQHEQQTNQPPSIALTNPTQRRISKMLSDYVSTLDHPDFLSRLHYKLHMYQTAPKETNSNNHTTTTAASELRTYYATRPGLRKYTLGVELDRMDYELILENGKRTGDKDVIRSYFGVGNDGELLHVRGEGGEEEGVATVEDVLIRSANQSLLADALVALTETEDDVVMDAMQEDEFISQGNEEKKSMGLILSGPTLCMTSVAETCQFIVDLQSGKVEASCDLAISIPFHQDVTKIQHLIDPSCENVVENGRLILACAKVSVRFRPGSEDGVDNDEPTVQYAVQSVKPFHSAGSLLLQHAAISLAHDQEDPFFPDEFQYNGNEGTTDVRDLFLLNHHLLSDSRLLAVSDHLVRLRGAAEASSTGFRSALRQLDGATNVSGKLHYLKSTTGGGGFSGFGLALPSAEEIEAAEREAAETGGFSRRESALRFPRPDTTNQKVSTMHNTQTQRHAPPPPPPPPPPIPAHTALDSSRPRPLIGGLFMSGLSRLAAAATHPDEGSHSWDDGVGGGGTGLTPPSSPGAYAAASQGDQPFTLYRREENNTNASSSAYSVQRWDGSNDGTGMTPMDVAPHSSLQTDNEAFFGGSVASADDEMAQLQNKVDPLPKTSRSELNEEDTNYGGWSDDDDFDFEDAVEEVDVKSDEPITTKKEEKNTSITEANDNLPIQADEPPVIASTLASASVLPAPPQPTRARPLPPAAKPTHPLRPINTKNIDSTHSSISFEEEFTIVLKEQLDEDAHEMNESGRMKRWSPMSEDSALRQRLIEVMMKQLNTR